MDRSRVFIKNHPILGYGAILIAVMTLTALPVFLSGGFSDSRDNENLSKDWKKLEHPHDHLHFSHPEGIHDQESFIETKENLNAQRVFVKDFYKLDDFIDSETRYSIERRLYANTVMLSQFDLGLYTGTVRRDSLSDTSSGNKRTTQLTVDVEPANLTYQVLILKEKTSTHHTSTSVYITCAPEELQIDKSAKCSHGVV